MSAQRRLTENDIRPDHLQQRLRALMFEDLARMLMHKDRFVRVPCPACASVGSVREFDKYDFSYERCENCDTLFINPRPDEDLVAEFYRTSKMYEFWDSHIYPASEEARRQSIFVPRVEQVLSLCKGHGVPTGRLVEVGAGYGIFAEELGKQNAFDDIVVIEPSPGLADACRQKGLNVIEKPLERVEPGSVAADVAVSFEVIEHIFDPVVFMENLAATVKPGGFLILTCPNIRGFDLMSLGPVSDNVNFVHLNYFHPGSLPILADRVGFDTVDVITPGRLDAELVRKKALTGEIDLSDQPLLGYVLGDGWGEAGEAFQRFLADNRLSSHMWAVFTKRG